MNTKSIVVESNYVSKDYLHDYALYYSLCFTNYSKVCNRVHFFSNHFDEVEFNEVIRSGELENQEFWSNYLGFIVVKPIPFTVIGYTVLKTYSTGNNLTDRNFWGIRDYKVHLYGNEINLASLAFQEQDSVLSACATTSIWAMLNKASLDFHTTLKSPSQITKDADKTSFDGSRLFPNKGLSILQICQAIQNSGLVCEIKKYNSKVEYPKDAIGVSGTCLVVNKSYFQKILNAYSEIGIPIIAIISVPNSNSYGLHAISISGFKKNAPTLIPPREEISWLSDNIEKFYAHDDQWGPFARVYYQDETSFITPWTQFHHQQWPTFVTNVIVPLYPKIRISYEDIEFLILGLDRILTFFFKEGLLGDLVWDIKLNYSENFKRTVKNSLLDNDYKLSFISASYPKYIWISTCFIGDQKVFDITFDATDIKLAMIGLDFICYFPQLKPTLKDFLINNRAKLEPLFNHNSKTAYYDFLIRKLV